MRGVQNRMKEVSRIAKGGGREEYGNPRAG